MFASPANESSRKGLKIAFTYTLVTVLCAVFGAVYEAFSHGVYAFGMMYAFAIPLLGGVLPSLLLLKRSIPFPSDTALQFWHFSLSAWTVGSLFSGALEIYGTTNRLTVVYWITGAACLLISLMTAVLEKPKEKVVENC